MRAPRAHEIGAAVRRRDRAQKRAGWAQHHTPSRRLALHFGVSDSRVRHYGTDDPSGPLTMILAAVADPDVDGGAIVLAVLEAFDDRFLDADRATLKARLHHLKADVEHTAEACQNRALQCGSPDRCDRVRDHAKVLIEIAALEERVGVEEAA